MYTNACHVHVELEHKAYCAIKFLNVYLTKSSKNRLLKLNKLEKNEIAGIQKCINIQNKNKNIIIKI